MQTKNLLILLVGVIAIGGIFGYILNMRNAKYPSNTSEQTIPPNTNTAQDSAQNEGPTPTNAPTPTLPPISDTVVRFEGPNIIVSGTNGEMTIPKEASIVHVFRLVNGVKTPATFDDIQIGMSVTLKAIVPGKNIELIIEQ